MVLYCLVQYLDVLDGLPGVVGDGDVARDLLAVVVDLAVQSDLQVELALGEGEALADEGARKPAAAAGGSKLELRTEIHQHVKNKANKHFVLSTFKV